MKQEFYIMCFCFGILKDDNPIWLPPWDLLDNIDFDKDVDELCETVSETADRKKKKLPRYLTPGQERKLMKMIAEHITEDGRWVGLLILLWCGVRPSEVRGLRYEKLIPFSGHPERRDIQFYELLEKGMLFHQISASIEWFFRFHFLRI